MTAIVMVFGFLSPAMATEYVYELTDELTTGEYLIVNTNTPGSGYALGYDTNSIIFGLIKWADVERDEVSVNNNNTVATNNYIEETDVNGTSKWTVAKSGDKWTFTNSKYHVNISNWGSPSLQVSDDDASAWTWDNTNKRLYCYKKSNNRYLYYSASNFSITTTASSVYLYKKVRKKEIITVNPTELSFETTVGFSIEKTFRVKGTYLQGDITATLTGTGFSINATTISKADAESNNGKEITVTFNPTAAGNYSGSITLSTSYGENVTINLTGIAHAPKIEVDPATLTFETAPGTSITQTFIVTGTYLKGDITASVTTGSDKFSIDANTISITDAESSNGKKIKKRILVMSQDSLFRRYFIIQRLRTLLIYLVHFGKEW